MEGIAVFGKFSVKIRIFIINAYNNQNERDYNQFMSLQTDVGLRALHVTYGQDNYMEGPGSVTIE